ncbi:transposable element tc3 transposase [Plakobranchus ocellatus]|uniref:Transposable element tc3 transposase n=1 Tax=Plakobranchus ocellatus TaxID=259542 RepID=A0AAV4BK75_9GAST|nr:transposable element tc3 transposase [Plakobranchus ocellatus]
MYCLGCNVQAWNHWTLLVMTKFWAALGRRRGINRAEQWFQQDGATPHTSNESLTWLRQRFPDRLISRRCDPEWAPHSPDLNLPDFHLWGYLKDNVYINNPQTIPDLKAVITQKIRQIPREECVRVIGNFARRLAEQWFQQDGATPHTSNKSLTWLRQRFPDRLISRRCDPEWAPHSPDLNPPDFYLWGYLKDNVYINNPQIIPDLKAVITQKIRQIPREECVRVIGNFARHLQVCLQRGGGHMEHILERQ